MIAASGIRGRSAGPIAVVQTSRAEMRGLDHRRDPIAVWY
jgi:hypothetical protein